MKRLGLLSRLYRALVRWLLRRPQQPDPDSTGQELQQKESNHARLR